MKRPPWGGKQEGEYVGWAVNHFESTWHMRNGKWTPCCFTRFQARLGTIQSTKFAGIKWKRMLSKRMNRYLTGFVRLTSFLGLLNWIMLSFKLFRGPAMQNRPFIRQCLILAMWSKGSPSGCYKFPCKIVKRIWSYIIQLKKPLTLQLVIFFCSHDLFARLWSENVMRSYILSTFEVFGVNSQISCLSPPLTARRMTSCIQWKWSGIKVFSSPSIKALFSL